MTAYEYFEPDYCWFCHKKHVGLSEHHLWRGWQRKTSPTVWLCQKCHNRATRNKQFEKHLQKLYNLHQSKVDKKFKKCAKL